MKPIGMIKYSLPIRQYVFFLSDQQPQMATTIEEDKLYFAFELIWMARIDYNLFLSSSKPDEIVFAVLGNFGSESPELVAQKLVGRLSETSRSQLEMEKYLEQLRILANLRKLKPFIEQIMESITKYFKPEEDFLYKKGEQLGLQKGEQSKQQEIKAMVQRFLQEGFLTTQQIAFGIGVSEEFVEEIRKEMS